MENKKLVIDPKAAIPGQKYQKTSHGPADIVSGGKKEGAEKKNATIWKKKQKRRISPMNPGVAKAAPTENICRVSDTA